MAIQVSKHAEMRMKERCGINKRSAQKIAEKAFTNGYTHSQTKGNLRKWVTSLYFNNKSANNIRLYGDKAYIFTDEMLITVLQLPSNLRNDMRSLVNGRD
jgi:hypothetical protein